MSEKDKDEPVTKGELDEFAEAVRDAVCKSLGDMKKEIEAMRSDLEKPMAIHRCTEEGCTFQTDDIGAFVQHIVKEETDKLGAELPKPVHVTAEEFLACPECFPEFEKAFLEKGWKKPEPKRESGGLGI